jgi:hypothetical protein
MCKDRKRNYLETDVDCGGGRCNACGANKKCVQDADCAGALRCVSEHGSEDGEGEGDDEKTCALPRGAPKSPSRSGHGEEVENEVEHR